MTTREVTEIPEETGAFISTLQLKVRITEEEITGRGYDEHHDEYHETTRKVRDETDFIECPVEKIIHKETGEEIKAETLELKSEEVGIDTIQRTDYDEVEYTIDGEKYVATYNMSRFENF